MILTRWMCVPFSARPIEALDGNGQSAKGVRLGALFRMRGWETRTGVVQRALRMLTINRHCQSTQWTTGV